MAYSNTYVEFQLPNHIFIVYEVHGGYLYFNMVSILIDICLLMPKIQWYMHVTIGYIYIFGIFLKKSGPYSVRKYRRHTSYNITKVVLW